LGRASFLWHSDSLKIEIDDIYRRRHNPMANVVNLTAGILRRIIQEERENLIHEGKRKKAGKGAPELKKHSNTPPEPKVPGGKKSAHGKQADADKKKRMKALSLEATEVDADAMAETIAKHVTHLKEVKSIERRLRTQLRLVLEKKNDIEHDLADLL